jgi:hypothetical protein
MDPGTPLNDPDSMGIHSTASRVTAIFEKKKTTREEEI